MNITESLIVCPGSEERFKSLRDRIAEETGANPNFITTSKQDWDTHCIRIFLYKNNIELQHSTYAFFRDCINSGDYQYGTKIYTYDEFLIKVGLKGVIDIIEDSLNILENKLK